MQFDMAPDVVLDSLVSMRKFCGAEYATICDEDKVNIHNVNNIAISTLRKPILKE